MTAPSKKKSKYDFKILEFVTKQAKFLINLGKLLQFAALLLS